MGFREGLDKLCCMLDGGKPYTQIVQELRNEVNELKCLQNKDINLLLKQNERLQKEINEQKKARLKIDEALAKSKEKIIGLENENKDLYKQLNEIKGHIPNNTCGYNEDFIIQFIIKIIHQSSLFTHCDEKNKIDTLYFFNEKLEELLSLMGVDVLKQVGIRYNSKFAKIVSTI